MNSLGDGAFPGLIRRMDLANVVTGHEMRTSSSTWAYETIALRDEIIEAALSHSETDAVEAA